MCLLWVWLKPGIQWRQQKFRRSRDEVSQKLKHRFWPQKLSKFANFRTERCAPNWKHDIEVYSPRRQTTYITYSTNNMYTEIKPTILLVTSLLWWGHHRRHRPQDSKAPKTIKMGRDTDFPEKTKNLSGNNSETTQRTNVKCWQHLWTTKAPSCVVRGLKNKNQIRRTAAILKIGLIPITHTTHWPMLMKFGVYIWRSGTRGGLLAIKNGTRSRNEPSVAAILNFVFAEYLRRRSKYLHQIWHIGTKLKSGLVMVKIYFI